MIYKQTVSEIRAAANAVNPNGRFHHGRVVDSSQAFKGSYPLIFLYPWRMRDPEQADILYVHPLVVAFWEQDKPHSSMEEREDLISRMEILKDAFVAKLRENSLVDVSRVTSEPQYFMHNGSVSGYAISFEYKNTSPC